jgi:dipeptidyl aminopeptidase/acylaminoacyl peptidase
MCRLDCSNPGPASIASAQFFRRGTPPRGGRRRPERSAPPWCSAAAGLALSAALFDPGAAADVREVGQLVFDGVPEIPARIVEKTNQYQNIRPASFADWIPGGGLVVLTTFADAPQAHRVLAPGAARRQLTFFPEPVGSASFGKAGDWMLITKDVGGNENAQIYRFDLRTGEETLLTDGSAQNSAPVWSNARSRVAWRSTVRNDKDHDVWVMDPLRPEAQRIVAAVDGYWQPIDWSPDDRKLLVIHEVSANETYLWVMDVATGEKTAVANHARVKGDWIAYGGGRFDATGEGVFFTSDEGSEFQTLRWTKVGSKKSEVVVRDIPWDVSIRAISDDRSRMAFAVNADGADELYLMDTKTRAAEKVPLPLGLLGGAGFSPDGKSLAITFESTSTPRDVYTVDVATKTLTRWTEGEAGGLDPATFVPSKLIHFPTFDTGADGKRRMIPAFLYRPRGEGPFPVVIRIHGGPESQATAWFSYTSQYEVNELGCAVIYPNVRGSSGYGKTYLKLDDGYRREDSVKDIGALLDWIAAQPDLDASRVAVDGGSYGGYMVLACLTHYPDRLRAGLDEVGISNFVTFLENTSEYRRDLRRVEYGDERDPKMREFLQRISPRTNAAKIRSALCVIQGANDPRVPASEAEEIVKVVRANGNPAWYLLAKDEGHGFAKKSNRDQELWTRSLFWEEHLLPAAGGMSGGTGAGAAP